ncbi:vomeronasal type-2 receptor 26-like [Podarcis raffonei]|uniref:vomeronasal type-2 receptor 26-like n=1 Tax=Podarcis raffonei TaxID=65483 RepID=UPI00232975FC|nr:vomeronasal type-2 receptor 26-like [Podarcis raffonei]
MTSDAMLELLAGSGRNIPNYHCGEENPLLAVLGRSDSDISKEISTMSGIYKIPQLSYGFRAQVLEDKTQFPFLYQMLPKEESQYQGIVELLLHFRWNWIGLLASDNDSGERFESIMTPLMNRRGICIALSEILTEDDIYQQRYPSEAFFNWRQVGVFVCYVTDTVGILIIIQLCMYYEMEIGAKIWITTAFQDISASLAFPPLYIQYIHGSLSFAIKTRIRSTKHGYDESLSNLLFYFLWEAFHCSYSKHVLSPKGRIRCREKEERKSLPQGEIERVLSADSYGTYISVQAAAQALNAAFSSRPRRMLMVGEGAEWEQGRLQPWQLHPFLKEIQCLNTSRGTICLDENWELPPDFDILNWVMFHNESHALVKIGSIRREASTGVKFTINPEAIEWPEKFHKVGDVTEEEG